MFERRSLRWPITLGVVMFVVLVLLLVGWIVITALNIDDEQHAGLYIALLSIGATLLTLVIVGTAMYLTLSIKAINLTQRQSNFIDSVTHELKSPIASLKLYLQTLNRRSVPAAEQEAFFKDMLEDVERLDQLVSHLLDVARLERNREGKPPREIRLDQVIGECAAELCQRYERPTETIRLELAPALVVASQVDLELVFRNLLDNAMKYADEERPVVEVTLRQSNGGQVAVRVSDNGRGIPLSLRHRIFGRFVRLGSELEREKPGTGLGLYIVRTLVGRLGGTIRIRDRDQGSGASFEVLLPGQVMPEEYEQVPPGGTEITSIKHQISNKSETSRIQ